jgi:rod shape-determining protein MreD
MTPARVVAAAAAIASALLLQASVIAPAAGHVPVSLPAVLVAAIALVDGPATGIAFGFACGLAADLGSTHPAGVLALCWLAVGLAAGLFADRYHLLRDAAAVAVICAFAGAVGTVLLTVVHAGTQLGGAVTAFLPSLLGDVVLALLVVPVVRRMLRSHRLRRPHPVARELVAAARHG